MSFLGWKDKRSLPEEEKATEITPKTAWKSLSKGREIKKMQSLGRRDNWDHPNEGNIKGKAKKAPGLSKVEIYHP